MGLGVVTLDIPCLFLKPKRWTAVLTRLKDHDNRQLLPCPTLCKYYGKACGVGQDESCMGNAGKEHEESLRIQEAGRVRGRM